MKVISDIAFDCVDEDGSGGLDTSEISNIMINIAQQMGVTPPTEEDLRTILTQLDEDYDGIVDK